MATILTERKENELEEILGDLDRPRLHIYIPKENTVALCSQVRGRDCPNKDCPPEIERILNKSCYLCGMKVCDMCLFIYES